MNVEGKNTDITMDRSLAFNLFIFALFRSRVSLPEHVLYILTMWMQTLTKAAYPWPNKNLSRPSTLFIGVKLRLNYIVYGYS